MAGLLAYTQKDINLSFLVFFASCIIIGIAVEIIGTSTGWLFGNYQYGTVLGPAVKSVPWIIGINWFIVMYCCGVSIEAMLAKMTQRLSEDSGVPPKAIQTLSVVVDGATLAVIMDWLIEPVAIKLGYWNWNGDGDIPIYNYLCWFIVSVLMLTIFRILSFDKGNKFAVNLLLIQAMFFLLLRTFL